MYKTIRNLANVSIAFTIITILLAIVAAVVPAWMAYRRGRSPFGYFLFGLVNPLIAIIVLECLGSVYEESGTSTSSPQSLVYEVKPIPLSEEKVECPVCGKEQDATAEKCCHCAIKFKKSSAAAKTKEEPRIHNGEPVVPIIAEADVIICPVCNARQRANRKGCYHCGATFAALTGAETPIDDQSASISAD